MEKTKNRGKIKRETIAIEEKDLVGGDETGDPGADSGVENDENSGLTIGDLGSSKKFMEKIKDRQGGTGEEEKDTKETAEAETENGIETDIIGEYQEVVGQFKNEFGGAFRDISKDTQDDLSSAHKELQNLERKIEGLKTEKAKENAREKAEQILEELRAKMQEIKDSGSKEKKQGTGAEGDEDKNEVAKAKRAETKEEWIEREKSDIEERMAEEDRSISKAYGSAIYKNKEFFDEKSFGLTNDIIKESQGVLEEQMKDVLVEDAKNWLKEQDLDNYPALEGQDIDELSESRIMDLVKNEKDFMEQLDKENEEWQKIRNLRDSIEKDSPPDVKLALFKRLSEGELKEKVWEKLTGENLDEKAKEEAGIGEQNDFVEAKVKDFETSEINKVFEEEWNNELSPEQQELAGDISAYAQSRIIYLKDTLNKNLKGEKNIEEKDILALFKKEGTIKEIENIKATIKIPFKNRKINAGPLGKITSSKFEAIIQDGKNKIGQETKEIKENAESEWKLMFENKRIEIVDAEAEKSTEDTIENCYQKIARNRAAKFLEMNINKDPKRKAKIEKKFGRGKREDIKDYISDAIEVGETIEDGSGYDENEDELKESLEKFHIDPEKLTKEQKEKFEEDCKKKYGLIQWIFDILFEKIKGVIKGNKAATKK